MSTGLFNNPPGFDSNRTPDVGGRLDLREAVLSARGLVWRRATGDAGAALVAQHGPGHVVQAALKMPKTRK
jgi:hypothetical protein